MVRRRFGYVGKLPSGRFHASFLTPDVSRHNALRPTALWRTRPAFSTAFSRSWSADTGSRMRGGERTLRECCEAYLEESPRVGERWAETCRRNMRLHLDDLLDRPIATITPR